MKLSAAWRKAYDVPIPDVKVQSISATGLNYLEFYRSGCQDMTKLKERNVCLSKLLQQQSPYEEEVVAAEEEAEEAAEATPQEIQCSSSLSMPPNESSDSSTDGDRSVDDIEDAIDELERTNTQLKAAVKELEKDIQGQTIMTMILRFNWGEKGPPTSVTDANVICFVWTAESRLVREMQSLKAENLRLSSLLGKPPLYEADEESSGEEDEDSN